jgi:hypothetical protein
MQNPDFMLGKKKKKKGMVCKKNCLQNHVLKMKNFGFGKKEKKMHGLQKKIAFKKKKKRHGLQKKLPSKSRFENEEFWIW